MRKFSGWVVSLLIVLLAGCGGGGSDSPPPPPTPTIVLGSGEPLNGSVTLSLSSASGGSVSWFVDLAAIGTGESVTWNSTGVTNGSHVVLARITASGTTTDVMRTVNVSNPTVHLALYGDGSFTPPLKITGTGTVAFVATSTAGGVTSVSATLDGVSLGSLAAPNACSASCNNTNDLYSFTVDGIAAGTGNHAFVATATDANGSVKVTVPLLVANAPVVTLDSPADGAIVSGTLAITGHFTTDDPGGAHVTGYLGSLKIVDTTATTFDSSYSLASVLPGSYAFSLNVTSADGQTTSVVRTIVVEASTTATALLSLGGGQLLAADGTSTLFQYPDQTVFVRSTTGTPYTQLQGADTILLPVSWQLSGGYAFVSGMSTDCHASVATCVYQWAPDGSRTNLTAASTVDSTSAQLTPIAHDGYVLWSNAASGGSLTLHEVATGHELRVPLPTGADYMTNAGYDFAVASGTVDVFYPVSTSGVLHVYHWRNDGSSPTRVSTSDSNAAPVMTDGSRATWLEGLGSLIATPVSGGALSTLSTIATGFLARDGVIAWTETGAGGATQLKASYTGLTFTLASTGPLQLFDVRGGQVLYANGGKLYAWNSATQASTLLLDAVPFSALLTGDGHVVFTVAAGGTVYLEPLP